MAARIAVQTDLGKDERLRFDYAERSEESMLAVVCSAPPSPAIRVSLCARARRAGQAGPTRS